MALPIAPVSAADIPPDDVLVLFYGETCPVCAQEKVWLGEISEKYPDLKIEMYEVYSDLDGRDLMFQMLAEFGLEPTVVPVTVYRGRIWEGFWEGYMVEIESEIAAAFGSVGPSLPPGTNPGDEPGGSDVEPGGTEPDEAGRIIHIPLIGDVDVGSSSLVIASLVIGFVDGFNPCSLWALSVLLALVLRTGSRKRVLAVGGTFLVITASLYGFYIAGIYNVLDFVAHERWVRILMALIALTFGLINVKDYFWFKKGASLTISDKAKPGLYQKMRSVTIDGKGLPAVLAGTVALAAGVSILELPCTAGYPILWSNLVKEQGVALNTAVFLFLIYIVVYLLDEFFLFGAAVVTMRVTKMEEKQGRWLKLGSGMLMIVLAGVLVFAPRLMESMSGALITFLVAAVATVIVALVRPVRAEPR